LIVAVVFLLGSTATTLIGYRQDHFMASATQFAGAAVVIVLLAALAFMIPSRRRDAMHRSAPSAWLLGAVVLVFASAALLVPMGWGWGAVAALLGLDAAMIAVVIAWAHAGTLELKHQLALGGGAALAYGWHAFVQHPSAGQLDASVRVGNVVFLLAAIWLIWFAARRTNAYLR
jgi:hypothetical protein